MVAIERTTIGLDDVDRLESAMAAMPQVSLPVKHHFTPGLYAREILLPKGSALVSATHKTTHIFVISKGSVNVWTQANGVERLSAPHTGLTTPGTRRVIHALEDTIWITFHPNPGDETDLAKLEASLIEPRSVNEIRDMGSSIGICALPRQIKL